MKVERLLFVISVLVYASSMLFAYVEYLYPVWGYYGFTYAEPEVYEIIVGLALIIITASFLPLKMRTPGAVIVLILHCVVFVPAVVICLLVTEGGFYRYSSILFALTGAFVLLSLVARHKAQGNNVKVSISVFGRYFILLGWCLLAFVLIYEYHGSMNFVMLENVYDQRSETSSVGGGISYVKTYFSNVFTPIVFALGICTRRPLYFALGFSGFLLMYMITAERTIFLMPFLIIAFAFMLRKRNGFARNSAFVYIGLAVFVFFTSALYSESSIASLLAIYFLFRTLALPGLSISLYENLFGGYGYTYWSHVKGVGSFVDVPKYFLSDEAWPQLGVLVGKYIYNTSVNNYNANLFSGDGVAAAGAVGVVCIAVMLALWIYMLNKLAARWDSRFSILITLPLAIVLTNGHFFTMLLSFGGVFIILFFKFFSGAKNREV
jgi:hypothetical protein